MQNRVEWLQVKFIAGNIGENQVKEDTMIQPGSRNSLKYHREDDFED